MMILIYIAAILVFTVFDIVGYYYILTKKETVEPKKIWLWTYRALQIGFQTAIVFYLKSIDIRIMVLFIISHWFGLCDLLYYVLRGVWIKSNDMYWLWWTPFGLLINYIGKEKIHSYWLWYFSGIAVILSIGMLL